MDAIEFYFLNVGQGASCVIIKEASVSGKGNRAIVIDCGPERQTETLGVLKEKRVSFIDAIVVSHNHEDHYGALPGIVAAYRGRIGHLAYVSDREPRSNPVFGIAKAGYERKKRWFGKPFVISVWDKARRAKWLDKEWGNDLKLFFLSPGGYDAELAESREEPNDASAVVLVNVLDTRFVFSGDATLRTWRTIHGLLPQHPFACEVLAVPHHGGHLGWGKWPTNDLRWLFQEVLRPKYAIVSVGSHNHHNHPRREVIGAIAASGAKIMCTEITPQCVPIEPEILFGGDAEGRQSVPCAGTIRVWFSSDEGVHVETDDKQQGRINQWLRDGTIVPLCRAPAGDNSDDAITNVAK